MSAYYVPGIVLMIAAAASTSLQSCPTLCDPIDCSPPGSPVPRILQARILEWVAISFSSAWKWKVKVKSLSCVWLLATPWTTAYQAPPSMGFSRQEYWSGVPLPSPFNDRSMSKADKTSALPTWVRVGKQTKSINRYLGGQMVKCCGQNWSSISGIRRMRLSGMCTTSLEVIDKGWIDKVTFEQRLEENESELAKKEARMEQDWGSCKWELWWGGTVWSWVSKGQGGRRERKKEQDDNGPCKLLKKYRPLLCLKWEAFGGFWAGECMV